MALSVSVKQLRLWLGPEGGNRALFDGLDFRLDPGITCLLGPSGCGKTSLLRRLAGLPTGLTGSGEIDADDGQPLTGRVALMAQQDGLLPWLPVIDNVTLGYRLRGEPLAPIETEALALLDQLGLSEYRQRLPRVLSGGMRQRAALARTLLERRPLVLLDEPFSALDAITRHRLQTEVARLLSKATVLLVTHDPLEALRLGHRILVLQGRPARLRPPLQPPGNPPRAPDDPALLPLHGELLRRLVPTEPPCAVS